MYTLKILHVVASTDPQMGGVSTAVRTIINGLDKLGIVSEVASLDKPGAAYLAGQHFLTHALGPGSGSWCYSKRLIPWLIENLHAYEAVIIHGLWLFNGYAVEKSMRRLTAAKGLPCIFVMPHGMLDPYFQQAKTRKIKALRNWIYWKMIEQKVINNSDGLLFTCEEEKRLARKPFRPYAPKKELVVGLGVDEPPAFHPRMQQALLLKCPYINQRPYLLFLGRIHQKKGVDILIEAYSELVKRVRKPMGLHHQYHTVPASVPLLIIAGPNLESDFGRQILQLIANNPAIHNMVFFPGMLEGDAKWGAFYGCEAFVLPSHQENFGISVIESMACGKPVLISNQVNIWREIIEAGAGFTGADTAAGTLEMTEQWIQLSAGQKQNMGMLARLGFHNMFALPAASGRLKNAILRTTVQQMA
jgi:glycosyltransferase involved in cell wall biosynthesis